MAGRLGSLLFALKSHKAIAGMIVLDVAMTCAIACNSTQVIASRWRLLRQPTGLEDARLVVVRASLLGEADEQAAQRERDHAALRALAGVDAVANVGSMPYLDDLVLSLATTPGPGGRRLDASAYFGTPGHLRVLGARLLRGQDFAPAAYVPFAGGDGSATASGAILSESLAHRLFGNDPALGRMLYLGDGHALPVVGVVADLLRPHPSLHDPAGNHDTLVLPLLPEGGSATYVLRIAAGEQAQRIATRARAALERGGDRIVDAIEPFTETQRRFFEKDRVQLMLLSLGLTGLLVVTLVGLSGLSGYWVRQRARSIGIRRALGATRGDILRHFLLENLLVVGSGALLGMVAAIGLNHALVRQFDLPALTVAPVLAAALLVCLLGQLSVLRAAFAASRIAPRSAMGATG